MQHEEIRTPIGPGYAKPPVSNGEGYVNPFNYVTPNMFSGSILDLEPDTEYECRLVLSDPDGVKGVSEKSITVRTRGEPQPATGGHVYHVYPFGYQGQKCSACSRVIVDEKVYDAFVNLLKARVDSITVGPAKDLSNYMGPVINERSMKSILKYIETAQREGGKLVSGGNRTSDNGYYVRPTVIADVDPKATIAQQEIFGPVLAVIKAKDFDDALDIANNTEFGLTGAVYSKNPKKLEKAKREFHCGNLYLNRKCTGAMVGAHPFGGFNMSGTDSKAGGQDYLGLFLQAKSIATKVK